MAASEELPQGEGRMALAEGLDNEVMQDLEDQARISDAKAYAAQLVDQNMEQAVQVIKKWVTKGG
jgi:hypothetical protein